MKIQNYGKEFYRNRRKQYLLMKAIRYKLNVKKYCKWLEIELTQPL